MKYSKKMIKAIEKLRRNYILQLGGFETELEDCPLCVVLIANTVEIGDLKRCQECPWVIETGNICIKSQKKWKWGLKSLRNGMYYIPKQTLTKWRKKRIRELTEWIRE